MSSLNLLLFGLPGLAFRRNARQVLLSSFSNEQVNEILEATESGLQQLAAKRPKYGFGLNLLHRYLELDAALFKTLRHADMPTEEAGKLIETINWRILGPGNVLLYKLARLKSKADIPRVNFVNDFMFSTIFTQPFKREKLQDDNAVAFNVQRCPIAEYMKALGVPELTRYAACNLDHYMADLWGMTMKRSGTIASGQSHCDFRFEVKVEPLQKP